MASRSATFLLAAVLAASPALVTQRTLAFQDDPIDEAAGTKRPAPDQLGPDDPKPDEPKPEETKPVEPPADSGTEEKPAVDTKPTLPTKPAPVHTSQAPVADSPAKAILRQSAAAIKAAKSISFKLKIFGEGGILGGAPGMETDEKMLRAPNNANTWLIRAIGKGSGTSTSRENPSGAGAKPADSSDFDFVWGVNHVQWIDHAEKTVFTRPPTGLRGKSFQSASSAKLRYLMLPTPFQKELLPAEFVLEEPVTADGVLCDVVSTTGDRGSRDRYTIGQTDRFPRRIEKIFDSERVTGRYVTEFTNVKLDEELSENYFKIPVPDGYKEDIQEAPKAAVVPPAEAGETKPSPDLGKQPEVTTPAVVTPPSLPMAPEVEIPLASGNIQLSSLRGNIVVLDFFGTWALTSKAAHDELAKSVARYKDLGVRFISCAIREKNPDAATELFTRSQFSWDLAKRGDAVGTAFEVKTYPHWVVIDAEGHITYHAHVSRTDGATGLNAAIDALLGDRAPKAEAAPVAPTEAVKETAKPEETKPAPPEAAAPK